MNMNESAVKLDCKFLYIERGFHCQRFKGSFKCEGCKLYTKGEEIKILTNRNKIIDSFNSSINKHNEVETYNGIDSILKEIRCVEFMDNFKRLETPLFQVEIYYSVLDDLVLVGEYSDNTGGSYWKLFTSIDSYNNAFMIGI